MGASRTFAAALPGGAIDPDQSQLPPFWRIWRQSLSPPQEGMIHARE